MKNLSYIFVFLFICSFDCFAQANQANPAKLKCVSVINGAGDIVINWIPPSDPFNQFYAYEIFQSNSNLGPYLLINTIYTIGTTSFTHTGAGGNTQSRYYFIRTRWGPNGMTASAISDTLHSIFLSITGIGGGVAKLNYNDIHIPHLSTSYPKFDIYKNTTGIPPFNLLTQTSNIKYNDTVARLCNGTNYYYYIQLLDSSGCASVSNIANGSFLDNLPPIVPTLDSASVLPNGQTVLGWNPSPSPDCAGYIIYQVIGGINVPIDTVWGFNNTAYTYSSTSASTGTVQFLISAIDSCKNVSILSGGQTTMFLKSAYNVCAHSIQLQWNTPQLSGGISKYYIYISENGNPFILIDSTSNTNYFYNLLNYNSNYCIYVRAKSKSGITASSNLICFNAYGSPVPSFTYIRYVTIKDTHSVALAFYVDSTKVSTGIELLRSIDNINYQSVTIIPTSTNTTSYFYTDNSLSINTIKNSYYYKAYILDSCGNRRNLSNVSKTILLKAKKDKFQSFTAKLDWSDYQGWPTGVSDYYVFRKINNVLESTPRAILPASTFTYSDNYSDLIENPGKIGYVIIAAENAGNPYGFSETSNSNVAFVLDEGDIFIPDAFAPNGVNYVWKPVFQFPNTEYYQLYIYDKWGQQIFYTTDINTGWDGGNYPQDVYVYLIRYKNSRGEYLELKGHITLLR
ncbi:MAG TPA: gliding motility-associated C-terminal domain-containing protein [Bacteroidia bacterium]|nr:gliding motility-associated C-terminal domain-containing protein [Bacteroidia bacterium]